jgi:hypothetical protein
MDYDDLDISKSGNLFFTHNPRFTEKEEDSAFYYWHAFLGLAADYNEDHPLWGDFDDVRNIPFREWWDEIAFDLFATGLLPGAEVVDTEEEFHQAQSSGEIIVKIDPTCSRAWIDECLDYILRSRKIVSVRGPKKDDDEIQDEAKYTFYQTPDVRHIKICFAVYNHIESGIKKPVEIAKLLKEEHGLTICKEAMKDPYVNQDSVERTVKRYYKNAVDIIEGVGQGEFPVY